MHTADTPAPRPLPTGPHTVLPLDHAPAPVRVLARTLPPGWQHIVTAGRGILVVGERATEPNAHGVRPTVQRDVPVDSWALRAHHPDGRAARIVWCVDPTARTPKGKTKAPGIVIAWRGRHPDEHVPAPLTGREVAAYLAATTPAAALHAVEQVRADQAAATTRAAATRAANRATALAPVLELHPALELDLGEVAA